MSVAPPSGQNRVMIYGPKNDGTYIVEFRTADGEALAISVPASETRVLKHFQTRRGRRRHLIARATRQRARPRWRRSPRAGGGSEPGLSAQCSCSFSFSTVMGTVFALTKIATAGLKDVGPS
jgi:hypothetical protein